MVNDEQVQNLIADWVKKHVKYGSVRYYGNGTDNRYLKHIDEKNTLELAASLVRDSCFDNKIETDTAVIYEKTIMVLCESK
jgi:hypothetical protein